MLRRERFDRGLGADRREHRRDQVTMRSGEDPCSGAIVFGCDLEIKHGDDYTGLFCCIIFLTTNLKTDIKKLVKEGSSMDSNNFPSFDLKGQVALVTGAARGIGNACALALAHAGADVVLGLRDKNSAADL